MPSGDAAEHDAARETMLGEAALRFAQHGLGRCIVFGRIAGRHAAKNSA